MYFEGPARARTKPEIENRRRQRHGDGHYARHCRRRFLVSVFGRAPADPPICALSAPADPQCRGHRIGMLPTSLTAATELSRAKSISETSTSTHRTAALNSSDIVARVGINEAMLTPVAEWHTRCRVGVREEKSRHDAAAVAHASHTCRTRSHHLQSAASMKGPLSVVTEYLPHRVRPCRWL